VAWGGGSNAASGKSDKQQIIDLEHGLIAATNQKNVDDELLRRHRPAHHLRRDSAAQTLWNPGVAQEPGRIRRRRQPWGFSKLRS